MILKMKYTIQIYLIFSVYKIWPINNIFLNEAFYMSFSLPLKAIQATKKRSF